MKTIQEFLGESNLFEFSEKILNDFMDTIMKKPQGKK